MRQSIFLVLIAVGAGAARAENIDLSTVPARETVQLTIYNSEDLTLVRETRQVSFKKGTNPLQFSWAGTLIDPTSVQLRFLTQADKLELADTTFPHDKPQMLYWNVESELDGDATVEITYFTSGISWSADYVAVANPAETALRVEGFVRVTNNSGEEYEDAQVRLVVGRINLVEKIAQLAQVPVADLSRMEKDAYDALRMPALAGALAKAEAAPAASAPADAAKPKEIVKEGLSEYFIFTIEGTETIPNGWSKRLRSVDAQEVPIKIEYRYRPAEYGDQLVRMFLWTNDKDSHLGQSPLPDGTVRLFRDNGRDGLRFLLAQPIRYVPIGDKVELNLGQDPEVIFQLVKQRVWRDAIWLQDRGVNVFHRVDEPGVQIELSSTVAGWDEHALFAQRVRNYTGKPIALEVRRDFGGDTLFRSTLAAKNHDYRTVQYTATVDAGAKAELRYEVVQRLGHNQKQEHVVVEQAEVK